MPKAQPYRRKLRVEEYLSALVRHGRRVANRLVLADTPRRARVLADFYLCYAPEGDEAERNIQRTGPRPPDLPEHERCGTGMLREFDPTGWLVHYDDKPLTEHPAPEGVEGRGDGLSRNDARERDFTAASTPTPEHAAARQLKIDIARAAKQVLTATSTVNDPNHVDQIGTAILSTLAHSLAAKYEHEPLLVIYNAIVDEVNRSQRA